MARIQESAVEPDKRNSLSRIFNAKNDKGTVAAWRSDLDRILHVFEVRTTDHSLPTLLKVRLQTELALHTHAAVSNVHEVVANTQGVVANTQGVVANTHGVVANIHEVVANTHEAVANTHEVVANASELISDIHRTILKDQEGVGSRNQMVGNRGVPFAIEKSLQLSRLEPGLQIQP